MSDLEPRRRSGLSRRARERRAYTLTLATGGFAAAHGRARAARACSTWMGLGPAVVTALLAVGSGLLLRRTLNS